MFKSIVVIFVFHALAACAGWTVQGVAQGGSAASGVPYTGATSDLDLGTYTLTASEVSLSAYVFLSGGPATAAYWKINNDGSGNLINTGRGGWAMRMGDDGVFNNWGLYTDENWGIPIFAGWYSRGVSINQHVDHGAGLDILKDNSDHVCADGYGAHIVMRNSLQGQNVMSSIIDNTTVGKWRSDFLGNLHWVAGYSAEGGTYGSHYFWVGGDYTSGQAAMCINPNGRVMFGGNLELGLPDDGSSRLQVAGSARVTEWIYFGAPATAGAWRMGVSGDTFIVERYDGMAWVTKSTIQN